jgi:HK97 family phage major capsid protein
MNVYIQREFEAYRKDDAEARSILDTAAEETRSTTAEEDERFDALLASAQAHKARADKLTQMDTDASSLNESVRGLIDATSDASSGTSGGAQQGEALILSQIRAAQETIRSGGDAFRPVNIDVDFDIAEIRAIADFSDSAKLYVSDFSTRVAVYQRTMSPWINLGMVINATNGRPLILPNSTVDPTSYTPGEGTAITESTPTLGTATATPVSYKALAYVSAEAEEDEVIGLLQIISRQQGRSLGLAFGTAATAAVLSGATNGGTATGVGGDGTATVAFFGYEDLLDLKYGAAAPYRLSGVWAASNGAIKKIRKFKDANRQYYWQPAIAAGQPDTFDGQPIYEDPALATPASATKSVVYGDPQSFVIKQMPLRLAVSTEFAFNLDNVALKAVYRAAGAVQDTPGLRYLVSANT